MTAKRRTNLRQIAQMLGLSPSTVSRALRELPGIHPETRQQIFEAAQTLGYRGGEITNQKRFSNILTLSQGIGSNTDQEYLAGMSSAAVHLNMSLISHHYRPDACANVLKTELQPRALSAGQVDGIVLIHRWPEEIAHALRERAPVVSVIHDYPGADIDVVSLDDASGVEMLVNHLVAVGARRIGFFGLCAEMSWARSRFGGFVNALILHGLEIQMRDVVGVTLAEALSEHEFHQGQALGRAATLTRDGVEAWLCASEVLAHALHSHLTKEGLKIPRDVAITGYHASQSFRSPAQVQLTSTEAPSAELGAAALRRLVHRIEGTDTTRRIILLPCAFKQGSSTKKTR